MHKEEFDLRRYFEALLAHWKWIAGSAIGCALAALAFSLLQTPTYEASALVAVTQPRYALRFDPRLESIQQLQPPYRAFPVLATSDEVLRILLEQLPSSMEIQSLGRLRRELNATNGIDPSLILLKVRSAHPEEAAELANTWAEILVIHANTVYGRDAGQTDFFSEQLAQSQKDLDSAERALTAFQAENPLALLSARLNSLLETQAEYLTEQREILFLMRDMRSVRAQLTTQPDSYTPTFADRLTLLLLQVRAFNVQSEAPIQILLDNPEMLSTQTISEQIDFLDELITVLGDHSQDTEERLVELEPDILNLQGQIQQSEIEEKRLTRILSLAQETHQTLSRKVDESRIAAADKDGEILLASRAAAPERAVSPRTLLNVAVAGTGGGMLGVVEILALQWWRKGREISPLS